MRVYLLLGSNKGNRNVLLQQATELIRQRIGTVVLSSRCHETEPWGAFEEGEDHPFLNQALCVETDLSPHDTLLITQAIEKELGRERPSLSAPDTSRRYTARPIDIDLIYCDDLVCHTPDLVLPHPRMHLRRFVLQPLCEIAPDKVHPLLHKSNSQLLQECPE